MEKKVKISPSQHMDRMLLNWMLYFYVDREYWWDGTWSKRYTHQSHRHGDPTLYKNITGKHRRNTRQTTECENSQIITSKNHQKKTEALYQCRDWPRWLINLTALPALVYQLKTTQYLLNYIFVPVATLMTTCQITLVHNNDYICESCRVYSFVLWRK